MSDHNDQHQENIRRLTPGRDEETDHLLLTTEQMLANTRRFFDGLEKSEENSRIYIEQVKAKLENEVRRLRAARWKIPESGSLTQVVRPAEFKV